MLLLTTYLFIVFILPLVYFTYLFFYLLSCFFCVVIVLFKVVFLCYLTDMVQFLDLLSALHLENR